MIETERLLLRPLTVEDAPALEPILSQPEVASQLPSIPHPLPPGGAEEWIREASRDVTFGVERREDGVLMGTIGLNLDLDDRGQLGGFLGKEYWYQGYASEATRALIRYGRRELGLKRIFWIRTEKTYDLDVGEEHLGWPGLRRVADGPAEEEASRPSLLARLFRRS